MRSQAGNRALLVMTLVVVSTSSILSQDNSWIEITVPEVGAIEAIQEGPDGALLLGTSTGLYLSTGSSSSSIEHWSDLNDGLPDKNIRALHVTADYLIFVVTWNGVFRRHIEETGWTVLPVQGITGISYGKPFFVDAESQMFLGTSNGLYRSTDLGATWTRIHQSEFNYVYAVTTMQSGNIYVSTIGGIFESTDAGSVWTKKFTSPQHTDFIGLCSTSLGTLLGDFGDGFLGRVRRSIDGGMTWTNVTNRGYVSNFVIDAESRMFHGREGYSTTIGGVFWSDDDGETWSPMNSGLTDLNVRALAILGDGRIMAGTKGGKLFRTMHSTVTSIDSRVDLVPQSFSLQQNFPNPFNSTTTFVFTIPERGYTSLLVFNAEGREVATLASKEFHAGTHIVPWYANDLPSGLYFSRLVWGLSTAIVKTVLVK
jgi:hypothetical protein